MKLLPLAIGAGALYLFTRFFGLSSLAGNVTTRIAGFRILGLDFNGLRMGVVVQIVNPTKQTMQIGQPFVTLTSSGNPLAQSNPSPGSTQIKPEGITNLPEIVMQMPLTAALPLFGSNINLSKLLLAWKGGFQAGSTELLRQIKVPLEVAFSFYADDLLVRAPAQKVVY